jgi:serine-type D-Ala-D-Ala carboxypeptidase (penicillin-binding protein 5/6)
MHASTRDWAHLRTDSRRYRRRGGRGHRFLVFLVVLLVLVVVVAGVGAGLLATESTPQLKVTRVLPASFTFPGTPPRVDWPTQGEAAVAVAGIGSLGHSGATTPHPIASLAKIMTAYVILRDHPIVGTATGFTLTMNQGNVNDLLARQAAGQSVVDVSVGEQLNEVQLLEALLIASGNNIAPILASYDSGSTAAFVAKMNITARRLGMTSTAYTDPSGLLPTTVSTAADQTILAQTAMTLPAFAHIVSLSSVDLPVAGTVASFDTMLGKDGFVGLKTGSDSDSGGCFAFADQRKIDGRVVTIYGTVLGQDEGTELTAPLLAAAFTASQRLADSVAGGVEVRPIVAAGTPVEVVTNAQGHQVAVRATSSLSSFGWGGMTLPLAVAVKPVGRNLKAGQAIATVSGGRPAAVVVAEAGATMPALTMRWRLKHLV